MVKIIATAYEGYDGTKIGEKTSFPERIIHLDDSGDQMRLINTTSGFANNQVMRVILGPAPADDQVNGTNDRLGKHVLLTNTPDADTIRQMAIDSMMTGTTRILPTIITSEFDRLIAALEALKSIPETERQILGIEGLHIEGRWIDRAGIHNTAHMTDMTDAECYKLCEYGQSKLLKVVTISPLKVTTDQIKKLVAAGITVSIGHTNATFEQVAEAMRAGAKHITHLGNVMSGVIKTRRTDTDPTVIDGLLNYGIVATGEIPNLPRAVSSIIPDGIHIEDPMLRVMLSAHNAYGKKLEKIRCSITTDNAAHPADVDFSFPFGPGGAEVFYKAGEDKCSAKDGTLGGAATTQQRGIQKLLSLGVPGRNAIHIASQVSGVFAKRDKLDDQGLYDPQTLQMIGYFRNGVLHLLEGQSLDSYAK